MTGRTAGDPGSAASTLLVAAVIVHDAARDRIVVLRRGRGSSFGHGLWDLPLGKVEPGEPVTAAAVRELREETGLVVAPEALTLAHVLHAGAGTGTPHGYLTVVFAATAWSGEPENREPDRHDDVRWAELDSLPREFVPSTEKIVRAWRAGLVGPTLHRWE
ncbi:NUDIX domain-containing protein [Actinacidiphila rubida]|uniref:ADP-ribose pyrophosphatase YjhB, NUDIX family n=1 Tax=Actinacidiphila rubida TaxID=310780 RepID=A0A1H8F4G4_9ACTN|nr:NUDIX domain-containing protein [Actinacidiphila rubida]SEN26653.1 ADP-ribose pyrophosphatase YjhB, NUDIX family [Actinacidiphila rubida]